MKTEKTIQAEPKKLQLSAKANLKKPASENEHASDLMIHVDSKIETGHLCGRLREQALLAMLDQNLSSLFSLTSHGSGWMLNEINSFYVKLASHVWFRGSSYLGLPSDVQNMNCQWSIRNREHNNCFLYCYVAAKHLAYAHSLYRNVVTSENQPRKI